MTDPHGAMHDGALEIAAELEDARSAFHEVIYP